MAFNLYDTAQGHAKDAADTKERDFVGSRGGGGLRYTEEEVNPTPVSGVWNVNYQPSTGHLWTYNFASSAWRRMMGFM